MKVFLAGIIQGSLPDTITPQDYRPPIIAALKNALAGAEVYDPIAEFPDSLDFDDEQSSECFFHLMESASKADLVVAYLPEASMGTAIEIWGAFNNKNPVVVISPLRLNWVLRFCADKICESIGEFEEFAASGGLAQLVEEKSVRA